MRGSRRIDEFRTRALPRLPELLRVATRQTGDMAAAEDAVQETFLRAWRGFDRFESGTNCRAWLYRILFFVLASQRRRRRRDRAVALEDAPPERLGVEPDTPDVLARGALLAAFEALTPEHRAVVQMADVEGLRYREIAEALGVPEGTVMSRLSRARRQLRRRLADRATRETGS